MKVPFFEHFFRRFTKHDSYARYFHVFVSLPFFMYLNGLRKRYKIIKPVEDDSKDYLLIYFYDNCSYFY